MLIEDLQRLGIRKADKVAVHTSYRKIRPVSGGPQTVIGALMRQVTRRGTILMPTCHKPAEVFRLAETPSEDGIVTELFRRMPGVFRSLHPTHSVAVWGADAKGIAAAHAQGRTALGVDSPFDRLAKRKGKVLLLGVEMNRNSTVHVAEAYAGLPYLKAPYSAAYAKPLRMVGADGREREMTLEECPGCSEGFRAVEARMAVTGLIEHGMFGHAEAVVMRGADIIDTAAKMLAEDATALLCPRPECETCAQARRVIAEAHA